MFKKVAISIALLLALGCLALMYLVYFNFRAIQLAPAPTHTPEPTITPVPTQDVESDYVNAQKEIARREAALLDVIQIIVSNATESEWQNASWRNDLYLKFDELIGLTEESANMPHPPGWDAIQQNFQYVNLEFVKAKSALIDFVENQNTEALREFGVRLQLANAYIGTASDLIKAKGK